MLSPPKTSVRWSDLGEMKSEAMAGFKAGIG